MTKKQKKVYRKRLRDQQRHLKTLAVATSVTTFGVGVTAAAEEVIPPVETVEVVQYQEEAQAPEASLL